MTTRAPGLYWARVDYDGTGPAEEITVVEIDGDGDVWALGHPDPIDPARVTWLGIAAPPATFDPA